MDFCDFVSRHKCLLLAVVMCFSNALVHAVEEPERHPQHAQTDKPEGFYLVHQKPPLLLLTSETEGWFSLVKKHEHEFVAEGVFFNCSEATIRLPPLRVGDLIPVMKGVYRVEVIEEQPEQKIFFKRMPTAKAQLPPGVAVENKLCFVLQSYGELASFSFYAKYLSDQQGDRVRLRSSKANESREVTLAVGEQFEPQPGFGYKVVQIVPPDKKHQVLGWVEFEQVKIMSTNK